MTNALGILLATEILRGLWEAGAFACEWRHVAEFCGVPGGTPSKASTWLICGWLFPPQLCHIVILNPCKCQLHRMYPQPVMAHSDCSEVKHLIWRHGSKCTNVPLNVYTKFSRVYFLCSVCLFKQRPFQRGKAKKVCTPEAIPVASAIFKSKAVETKWQTRTSWVDQ